MSDPLLSWPALIASALLPLGLAAVMAVVDAFRNR